MKWTYTEFKTYVLITAAFSDMDFTDEEKEVITSKLDPTTYRKVFKEFDNDDDFQQIEKIRDAAKVYCDTLPKKEDLLSKVKFLFQADGNFDSIERNLLSYLSKLL